MKKKLQILFSTVVLLCLALSVHAQTSFAGADGKYYLKNVEAGKYFGASNSWGTQVSLLDHPVYVSLYKQSDGVYQLETPESKGEGKRVGSNLYVDTNPAANFTISSTDDGKTYTIVCQDGKVIGYDGSTNIVAGNLQATDKKALWEITSEADMYASLAKATSKKPVDATFLLKDPYFSRSNPDRDTWTYVKWGGNWEKGWFCNEKYKGTFTSTQTIVGAPKGLYKLVAQGFYRVESGGNENDLPFFFIGDEKSKANFKKIEGSENDQGAAGESFSKGMYKISPIEYTLVTDGDLVVGAKLASNTNLWCCWKNFSLEYYGDEAVLLAELNQYYDDAVKNWQAVQSLVNVWDNQVKDEVWKSTVKGDALDLMNIANDQLIATKAAFEKSYKDGKIKDDYADLKAKIDEVGYTYTKSGDDPVGDAAGTIVDQALAKAVANWAVAEAALKIAKKFPAGSYYIKNGSKYVGPANNWETQASLVDYAVAWTLATSKNGVYTFESPVGSGAKIYLGREMKDKAYTSDDLFCDMEAMKITIAQGATNFTLATPDEKFISINGNTLKATATATEWEIIPATDKGITTDQYGATYFIKDANIGRTNRFESAWTGAPKAKTSNEGLTDGKETAATRYAMEAYKATFSANQEVTVPEGYYTVNVQAFYRVEEGGKDDIKPVLFANNEQVNIKNQAGFGTENNIQAAAQKFEKLEDTYKNTLEVHVGKDGKLNLGVKLDENKTLWTIWKNFTLTFNEKDNTKYDVQTKNNLTSAWIKAKENYFDVKDRVAGYDKDGKIYAALQLIETNEEYKEIKHKDKPSTYAKTGWGFAQLSATGATDYANAITDAKATAEAKADSLYAELKKITDGIDSNLENMEIAKKLNKDIDDITPLWQATYDIINTKYNAEKILDPSDATEFKKEMADLRAEFVKELGELNTIDATFSTIKTKTIEENLSNGKLKEQEPTISAQISGLKDKIIATLNDAQTKSYEALENAYNDRDALYIAGIEVINKHYAGDHKAIADDTNVKLFAIHKALAKIYADATAEYAAVVAANKKALDNKALPTEGFGYANYIRGLEDVNVDAIATYLADANTAAIAANNKYIADNLRKTEYKDGKVVSDTGVQALEAKLWNALKTTGYKAPLTRADIIANKDKQYDEDIVDVFKKIAVLEDTLKFYQDIHEAKYLDAATLKALRDKGIKVYKLDKDGKETAEAKDTIFCVSDAAEYIQFALKGIEVDVEATAAAVKYSDGAKKDLGAKNTDLKTLWNKSYAGMNDKLDKEVDLQEIYEGIENIRINHVENGLFIYDEASAAEDEADIEEWTMALTNYDEWVVAYHEPGDANLDGQVTVADVILQVSYVLEEEKIPATKLNKYVTDADGDGTFDINDVQATIITAMGGYDEEEEEEAAGAPNRVAADITDYVVVGKGELGLVNTKAYASFQIDVTVADGATFNAPTLTDRASKLTMKYSKIGDNTYRVIGYNMKKATIEQNEGIFMQLNIAGNNEVVATNAIFSDSKATKYVLSILTEDEAAAIAGDVEEPGEVDAIAGIKAEIEAGAEIYTVGGAKLNKLQKGVNIIKKADGSVRKVFVK
jgi:hypothetical protein